MSSSREEIEGKGSMEENSRMSIFQQSLSNDSSCGLDIEDKSTPSLEGYQARVNEALSRRDAAILEVSGIYFSLSDSYS